MPGKYTISFLGGSEDGLSKVILVVEKKDRRKVVFKLVGRN